MGLCKCGTQMEIEKRKIDNTYRYYWVCPNPACKREQEFGKRQPVKGKER